MQNGRLAAAFTITPLRLHISSIRANLLGGDLQGDADVTNWQSSLEPGLSGRRAAMSSDGSQPEACSAVPCACS